MGKRRGSSSGKCCGWVCASQQVNHQHTCRPSLGCDCSIRQMAQYANPNQFGAPMADGEGGTPGPCLGEAAAKNVHSLGQLPLKKSWNPDRKYRGGLQKWPQAYAAPGSHFR